MDEESGSLDVACMRQWRLLDHAVACFILPGSAEKLRLLCPIDVRGPVIADPVRNAGTRDRGRKAVRILSDQPVRHEAAVRVARVPYPLRVDGIPLQHEVDAGDY